MSKVAGSRFGVTGTNPRPLVLVLGFPVVPVVFFDLQAADLKAQFSQIKLKAFFLSFIYVGEKSVKYFRCSWSCDLQPSPIATETLNNNKKNAAFQVQRTWLRPAPGPEEGSEPDRESGWSYLTVMRRRRTLRFYWSSWGMQRMEQHSGLGRWTPNLLGLPAGF